MSSEQRTMSTRAYRKFCELTQEYQEHCRETLRIMEENGSARPDEMDHIVDFYYDEFTSPVLGWFQWWESD